MMIKKYIYLLLILALPLSAKMLISPIDAMKQNFGLDSTVVKKNILLSKQEAKSIEQEAQVKLDTKIYTVFKATKDEKLLGHGILINKKVRSKNAVVIYFISTDSKLKAIEIIAFNEPIEYIPSQNWSSQFEDVSTDKMLRVSKEIPTITGATLSARTITDGSRLAFGIYNELLKEKQ